MQVLTWNSPLSSTLSTLRNWEGMSRWPLRIAFINGKGELQYCRALYDFLKKMLNRNEFYFKEKFQRKIISKYNNDINILVQLIDDLSPFCFPWPVIPPTQTFTTRT